MAKKKRLLVWAWLLLAALSLLVVLVVGFVIWGSTPSKPMPEAMAVIQSNSTVRVTTGKWLVFQPANVQTSTGFIFYPGGHVDYRAYAPAAKAITEQGYLVVIVPMPLNLAVFNTGAALDVMTAYPGIQHWAVGGHSLGGSMAANFAHSHPGSVQGLVLWASYPAGSDNLSSSGLRVLSISGTRDGLSTPTKIEDSHALLPSDATFVPIQGGDHAQFGWYGPQPGDNPAAISREVQQAQIIQATVDFLKTLK
jgi:pimeloyl-ACP methyl ester carboxylesterase